MKEANDFINLLKGFTTPLKGCKHVFVPSLEDPGQYHCKHCNVSTRKKNK